MVGVFTREKRGRLGRTHTHTHTHTHTPHRGDGHVTMGAEFLASGGYPRSQTFLGYQKLGEGQEEFCSGAFGWPCQHLDFRLSASRTVRGFLLF